MSKSSSRRFPVTVTQLPVTRCEIWQLTVPYRPGTLSEVLDLVDHVLIMSVNPGFGGQAFIPNALQKIQALAWRRKELGLNFAIEIDGGVSRENAGDITRAGCDWLVAGSSIFHTPDPGQSFVELQRAARDAVLIKV